MNYQFVRSSSASPTASQPTGDLAQVIQSKDLSKETWLFVSPHDDDICIGGGMWMNAAIEAGVNVQMLIVTDGRNGYCTLEQKPTICQLRQSETYESCSLLGLKASNIHFMGYPDGGLAPLQGRRVALAGEPELMGYTGLQNAFTYHLRRLRPTRVLVPTFTDLHPDHQVTHNELMISLFHASGDIWPELGQPTAVPRVYEMAVYCDFALPPNLGLRGDQAALGLKLKSIAAFRSQLQIAQLVEQVRQAGPYEFLREVDFQFYSAGKYVNMFPTASPPSPPSSAIATL